VNLDSHHCESGFTLQAQAAEILRNSAEILGFYRYFMIRIGNCGAGRLEWAGKYRTDLHLWEIKLIRLS
jgi:hypothetical protein